MKALCVAACVLVAAVAAVSAAGGAVLGPEAVLESFLESGSHSAAEIDAVAKAEVEALLGSDADSESAVEVEAEADAEMPRDTKAQEAAERRKARRLAKRRAAHRKPVAPPRPSADPVRAALKNLGGADDDIVRLVYDELQRLGTVSASASPSASRGPSSASISDPRIATLEHRLASFEKARWAREDKQQSSAISAINNRLAGLDATLEALQKSSAKQQKLSSRLLKVVKAKQAKEDKGEPVDYSVSYEKTKLPATFEVEAQKILNHFKKEARKIYERRCEKCKRNEPHTPKAYPKEGPRVLPAKAAPLPSVPGAPAAAPVGSPAYRDDRAPRFSQGADAPIEAVRREEAHAEQRAERREEAREERHEQREEAREEHREAVREVRAEKRADARAQQQKLKRIIRSEYGRREERRAPKAVSGGKPKKILFKPITIGKEPTPEGMRLSKALNDIALALPVTPAYQLSPKEKALHDVLGESAVNPKWKTAKNL